MRFGRFLSQTYVYELIEQYFNQYVTNLQQILENYETYVTDLTEITQILSQGTGVVEIFSPDKHPEVTSVDGHIQAYQTSTWQVIHDAPTAFTPADSQNGFNIEISTSATVGKYVSLQRAILLFDTSTIPSNALIVKARLEVTIFSKTLWLTNNFQLVVVGSNPASNVAITSADYYCLGTTPLSEKLSQLVIPASGVVQFELNAAGRNAINVDGITKLGLREYNYDVRNIEPTWQASKTFIYTFNSADMGSSIPKLVVEYILPAA